MIVYMIACIYTRANQGYTIKRLIIFLRDEIFVMALANFTWRVTIPWVIFSPVVLLTAILFLLDCCRGVLFRVS